MAIITNHRDKSSESSIYEIKSVSSNYTLFECSKSLLSISRGFHHIHKMGYLKRTRNKSPLRVTIGEKYVRPINRNFALNTPAVLTQNIKIS